MSRERTLVILKPDTVHRALIGTVIDRFERKSLKVIAMKMTKLGEPILREHYAHLASKPFFPEIVGYMTLGPVVIMVVEGTECVRLIRQLCGATNPAEAAIGTIRGDYAYNIRYNIIHASDSVETAEVEVKRFFTDEEICEYTRIGIE